MKCSFTVWLKLSTKCQTEQQLILIKKYSQFTIWARKEGSIYEISAIPSASVVVLLRSGVKGHEVETGKVGRQIK